MAKKTIFAASLALNALFLLLFFLGLRGGGFSFSFPDPGAGYLSSAMIVSVPLDGSSVSFGPVEIELGLGAAAFLQFAALRDGRQYNMAMDPLYDRGVLDVGQGGSGLAVRGVGQGESVLQLFSPSGFRDIAHVTVY